MSKSRKAIRQTEALFKPVPKRSDSEYLHLYHPHDEVCLFHERETELATITVKLPKPPDLKKIEGYGLHPKNQKFQRTVIPPKLASLNNEDFLDVSSYWNEIERNFEYYESELWFLEREWRRRRFGYWLFINGKPTWLPGQYYIYLNYWEMKTKKGGNRPDYRDRSRKNFIGKWYAATTTEAPFKYRYKDGEKWKYTSDREKVIKVKKAGGVIEQAEEGEYFIVDMKRRTVIGINEPKGRRVGATSEASSVNVEIATRYKKARNGIQATTEDKAYDIFTDFVTPGLKGYPFWFRPVSENLPDSESALRFKPAAKKTSIEKGTRITKALYSIIDYGSSSVTYYDGKDMTYYHQDEPGKTVEIDVNERTQIVAKAMSAGANTEITGLGVNTSTTGEMEKQGGKNFAKLCNNSRWEDRDDNGLTNSGYINLYIPSDEGLENFVDEFGNSLQEAAREHIMNTRRKYEQDKEWDKLNEEIRHYPLKFSECFQASTKNSRFNLYLINERLRDFQYGDNPFVVRGTFVWDGWKEHNYNPALLPPPSALINKQTKVRFVPTGSDNWDWELSYEPPEGETNKFTFNDYSGEIMPANMRLFTHGVDMYKWRAKTSSGKGSLGAGAIFRRYNPNVDLPLIDGNDINEKTGDFNHVTKRFCGIYLQKPKSKENFLEQQLMASVYFGTKTYPEVNVPDIWDWYEMRGFGSYLFFRLNRKTGKQEVAPGGFTDTNIIDSIFNLTALHIEHNGRREVHPAILEQWRDIDTDMNDFDLFTACGYALLSETEPVKQLEESEDCDISDVFQFELIQ